MIHDIRLQHFRSYRDASFTFEDGVNIIVGPNASGKTNLLEAILMLARGHSYRAKDAEIMRFEAPWTRVEAHTADGVRILKIAHEPPYVRKSFDIDGHTYQRLSHQKSLPVVLFEPNHLLLLHGAPDMRRNFLDDIIEQTVAGYATLRRNYRRVLSQRNALLKKGFQVAKPQIFVWDLRLSEFAGKLIEARRKLIDQMNELATETYQGLSRTQATLTVRYRSQCSEANYETALLRQLEAHLERDCLLGFTSFGPHRDDLQVLLNDKPSSETASRGETRTIILALKIIELSLLETAYGRKPLLLLDDVFSELDTTRRAALTKYLQGHQTFITTTTADVTDQSFFSSSHFISIA